MLQPMLGPGSGKLLGQPSMQSSKHGWHSPRISKSATAAAASQAMRCQTCFEASELSKHTFHLLRQAKSGRDKGCKDDVKLHCVIKENRIDRFRVNSQLRI